MIIVNLTGKKEDFLKNIVTNAREFAQLTETLKQKVLAKAQTIKMYEKGNPL